MTQDERDRISSLPDEVICHILSFLPTKYSFRTTLLSSRWKHLFAYVPVLDFDFLALTTTTTTTIYDTPRHSRFIDFVNRLLKLNKLHRMTKFRLNCDASQFPELDKFLVSWILSALFHNVEELNIVIYNDFTIIPDELFSCEMLSTLKLQGNFWRELPASACLPCLKTLHLRCVIFDFSFERLLSVFPVLEDLLFDSCILQNADISHPTLVKFSFDDCYVNELVINVPSLLCFDYLNSVTDAILGEVVLTSLIKARICCEGYILTKIVSVVSHARHLYLSTISIEDFQDSCPALPTFHNLTHLEVGEVTRVVLGFLPDLLNRSSHLEVLVFAEGFSCEESDDSELVCFENVPSCVSRNLKEIEFRKFTMKEIECKLVEYSLRNAQVLVKMKIQSHMSWKEKYEFRKKLRTFPKFSSDCQIQIDSEYLMGR